MYFFFTKILGEDALSEVFRKVSAAAKSAWAPVQSFNKAVGSPKTSALGRVGDAIDKVSGKFRGGLGSLTSWLPALGAIGSALTLDGLIKMTRDSAESFKGLRLSAEKLGVSAKDLAVWRLGAKETGVDAEALDKGLVKLKKVMEDAATGKNKDAALLFRRMGFSLRDANGHVKNVDKSLEDFAEAFHNNKDEVEKNAAAILLFGKAGATMLPFLNRGRDGIRQWREEQKKYSSLSGEQAANLGDLAEAYDHLDAAGGGLAKKLSAVFAPALLKVVNFTTDWVVANRDLIAQALERKLERIGNVLGKLGAAAKKAASALGIDQWWKGADAATMVDIVFFGLSITMAGPLLAAIGWMTKAWLDLNAAMLKNPIVAIVVLLVVLAVEVVKHWSEVKEVFRQVAEDLKSPTPWGAIKAGARLGKLAVDLLVEAIYDISKALFGIDMKKWDEDFGKWIGAKFEWAVGKAHELFDWMSKIKNVFAAVAVPVDPDMAPAYAGAGDRYAGAYGSTDPLLAGVNAAVPPPLRVELVVSGEVKAPPGSTIVATTQVGGRRQVADVGASMMPGAY